MLTQATNVIEAEMDLKVEKHTQLSEFNMLMQKLALKVWNECCQVFLKKESDGDSPKKDGLLSVVTPAKKEAD